jgi:activator of HSP90 ATPase
MREDVETIMDEVLADMRDQMFNDDEITAVETFKGRVLRRMEVLED